MPTFNSNVVSIHYEVHGEGQPIVLVHGFASSFARNWRGPGWVEFLTWHGYQVIGLDVRGHGASEKLYDPQAYDSEPFSTDVLRLLDHLHIAQADLMGYSMGCGIVLYLAAFHGARVRKVIVGGIGDALLGAPSAVQPDVVAAALESDDPASITDPVARLFRLFAARNGNDLKALAAVMRRPREHGNTEAFRQLPQPVLIVLGSKDHIAGSAAQLAHTIPHAQLVVIPDRDHMTTVGDARYKEAVLKFLTADRRPPTAERQ